MAKSLNRLHERVKLIIANLNGFITIFPGQFKTWYFHVTLAEKENRYNNSEYTSIVYTGSCKYMY